VDTSAAHDRSPGLVPFGEAVRVWARIAALSFGGPAGQIAVMHRILVEEKRWLGERRFLHALNYCMLLPGPEAQQLAVYVGWLMNRTLGGLVAGGLFVLPGFLSIMALSILYALYGELEPVGALFFGLKAAVLVIVVQAVIRLGSRSLRGPLMIGLAAGAFVAIYAFDAPFPLIILTAAAIGFVAGRSGWSPSLGGGGGQGGATQAYVDDARTLLGEDTPEHARPNLAWAT
jgi:chromate transporter